MFDISTRRLVAVFAAGLLVLGAGCTGLGASESAPTPAATETAQPTETTDGHDHSHGDTESTTETTATSGDGHDHDHSHGGTESTTATNDTDEAATNAATGKLTVVVAADELSLPARDEAGDGFDMAEDPHTWASSDDTTLAAALSRLGISATEDTLSVDGETYTDGDGTTVSYRVNGQSVDPEAVTLEDGDQVWVTVETPGMNASLPGTYIDNEQQHIHGDMTVTVDGEAVDFSRSRYQSNDRYFHFEGGVGEYWHSHSANLTLEYALDSLDGVDYAEDSLTINGTTYDESTVTYEVDGEAVDPADYHLKDGDDVTITVG